MPPTPPSGAPAPPQTDPPTTRHAAVPIDAREWRMRTELRCNALLVVALAVLVGAYLNRTGWLGLAAVVLGLCGLVASFWLRPALPLRAPTRRTVDEADLAVMDPMTPPRPIAAWQGLPTGYEWGPPVPVGAWEPGDPGTGARLPRERPARAAGERR